jgi:hypothetical protein
MELEHANGKLESECQAFLGSLSDLQQRHDMVLDELPTSRSASRGGSGGAGGRSRRKGGSKKAERAAAERNIRSLQATRKGQLRAARLELRRSTRDAERLNDEIIDMKMRKAEVESTLSLTQKRHAEKVRTLRADLGDAKTACLLEQRRSQKECAEAREGLKEITKKLAASQGQVAARDAEIAGQNVKMKSMKAIYEEEVRRVREENAVLWSQLEGVEAMLYGAKEVGGNGDEVDDEDDDERERVGGGGGGTTREGPGASEAVAAGAAVVRVESEGASGGGEDGTQQKEGKRGSPRRGSGSGGERGTTNDGRAGGRVKATGNDDDTIDDENDAFEEGGPLQDLLNRLQATTGVQLLEAQQPKDAQGRVQQQEAGGKAEFGPYDSSDCDSDDGGSGGGGSGNRSEYVENGYNDHAKHTTDISTAKQRPTVAVERSARQTQVKVLKVLIHDLRHDFAFLKGRLQASEQHCDALKAHAETWEPPLRATHPHPHMITSNPPSDKPRRMSIACPSGVIEVRQVAYLIPRRSQPPTLAPWRTLHLRSQA